MTFVLIKTVDGEDWWINPSQIYGISRNEVGNMEIFIEEDILETVEFQDPGSLMDYLGVQYNHNQIEEIVEEQDDD
tara:strand:- start:263 stop:490 length:228 start_codon:yes stop_codon:yes gene_type:complete